MSREERYPTLLGSALTKDKPKPVAKKRVQLQVVLPESPEGYECPVAPHGKRVNFQLNTPRPKLGVKRDADARVSFQVKTPRPQLVPEVDADEAFCGLPKCFPRTPLSKEKTNLLEATEDASPTSSPQDPSKNLLLEGFWECRKVRIFLKTPHDIMPLEVDLDNTPAQLLSDLQESAWSISFRGKLLPDMPLRFVHGLEIGSVLRARPRATQPLGERRGHRCRQQAYRTSA